MPAAKFPTTPRQSLELATGGRRFDQLGGPAPRSPPTAAAASTPAAGTGGAEAAPGATAGSHAAPASGMEAAAGPHSPISRTPPRRSPELATGGRRFDQLGGPAPRSPPPPAAAMVAASAATALALERLADSEAAVGSETSGGIDRSLSRMSTLSSSEGTVRDEWEVGREGEEGRGEAERLPPMDDEVAAYVEPRAGLAQGAADGCEGAADGCEGRDADATCQEAALSPKASHGLSEAEAAHAAAVQELAELTRQRGPAAHHVCHRQAPATVDVMCFLCAFGSQCRRAPPTRCCRWFLAAAASSLLLPLVPCCCRWFLAADPDRLATAPDYRVYVNTEYLFSSLAFSGLNAGALTVGASYWHFLLVLTRRVLSRRTRPRQWRREMQSPSWRRNWRRAGSGSALKTTTTQLR
jgi:hypothetical protein